MKLVRISGAAIAAAFAVPALSAAAPISTVIRVEGGSANILSERSVIVDDAAGATVVVNDTTDADTMTVPAASATAQLATATTAAGLALGFSIFTFPPSPPSSFITRIGAEASPPRLRDDPWPDGPPSRVLGMIARGKACEHPDKACHGESCPLAQGFYDRLPAGRQAASELSLLNQNALREVAVKHAVCPYYLSQEMARWADVVVADYNYYFDFSALLFGLIPLDLLWEQQPLFGSAAPPRVSSHSRPLSSTCSSSAPAVTGRSGARSSDRSPADSPNRRRAP